MGYPIGVLRRASRGERFQELHRRRREQERGRGRRAMSVALGVLLVVVGLVTYPIPGPPSTLMILTGLALVAQDWMGAARALDDLEVRLHALQRRSVATWHRLTDATKAVLGGIGIAFLASCGYGIYLVFTAG
jgi:hypothetical protein